MVNCMENRNKLDHKITKLKKFSLIFNIELIDRYVTNYYLNMGKEKDIPNYNPMVPSEY